MKYNKNKPTEKQKWWLSELSKQGYACTVCWSCKEAIEKTKRYLLINDT